MGRESRYSERVNIHRGFVGHAGIPHLQPFDLLPSADAAQWEIGVRFEFSGRFQVKRSRSLPPMARLPCYFVCGIPLH